MEFGEQDTIVFEGEDGSTMEFTIVHEFNHEGGRYAVLKSTASAGDTMIAEIADPMGPDEEFIPLPMKRQQDLLDYLKRGAAEED